MARMNLDFDSPIMSTLYKLCSLLWMSVLWLLCAVPVVTLGASTAAYYRMLFNMQDEKACTARAFWEAFRENFRKATALWLMVLLSAAALLVSFPLVEALPGDAVRTVLRLPQFLLMMAMAMALIYVFPLCAFFENTVGNTLRNALLMSLFHMRATLPCLLLSLVIPGAALLMPYFFLRFLPLWLTVAPAIVFRVMASLLRRVFEQYVPESQQ